MPPRCSLPPLARTRHASWNRPRRVKSSQIGISSAWNIASKSSASSAAIRRTIAVVSVVSAAATLAFRGMRRRCERAYLSPKPRPHQVYIGAIASEALRMTQGERHRVVEVHPVPLHPRRRERRVVQRAPDGGQSLLVLRPFIGIHRETGGIELRLGRRKERRRPRRVSLPEGDSSQPDQLVRCDVAVPPACTRSRGSPGSAARLPRDSPPGRPGLPSSRVRRTRCPFAPAPGAARDSPDRTPSPESDCPPPEPRRRACAVGWRRLPSRPGLARSPGPPRSIFGLRACPLGGGPGERNPSSRERRDGCNPAPPRWPDTPRTPPMPCRRRDSGTRGGPRRRGLARG